MCLRKGHYRGQGASPLRDVPINLSLCNRSRPQKRSLVSLRALPPQSCQRGGVITPSDRTIQGSWAPCIGLTQA